MRFSTWRACDAILNSGVPVVKVHSAKSGCSAAWLARYLGVVEVVGSNPASQIFRNPMIPKESSGFFLRKVLSVHNLRSKAIDDESCTT